VAIVRRDAHSAPCRTRRFRAHHANRLDFPHLGRYLCESNGRRQRRTDAAAIPAVEARAKRKRTSGAYRRDSDSGERRDARHTLRRAANWALAEMYQHALITRGTILVRYCGTLRRMWRLQVYHHTHAYEDERHASLAGSLCCVNWADRPATKYELTGPPSAGRGVPINQEHRAAAAPVAGPVAERSHYRNVRRDDHVQQPSSSLRSVPRRLATRYCSQQ